MIKKLLRGYKIYMITERQDANATSSDGECWRDLVDTSIPYVPYVDNVPMPLFDGMYSTIEEAEAEILKICPADNAVYQIVPVCCVVMEMG